jgi:ABC-2 type transport system ATP-binding protein
MIRVEHLKKDFVKYEKQSGLLGMAKAFFNAKKVIVPAVNDISFTIQDGEIVGYIGANGAGKSTTIKMLTGILTPSSGLIEINGIVPYKERTKNAYQIGVVFGQRTQLWWDLPLAESYTILKEIYGVSDADFQTRMAFFEEIFELSQFIKSPVRQLSLGQRMRADIVASLLHNPNVLFLDEPTIGLDVVAKNQMRQAIKRLNKEFNTTVILTTHDLDDIALLANRIIMIDKGTIIYQGTLEELKDNFGFMKKVSFKLKEQGPSVVSGLTVSEDLVIHVEAASVAIEFNKHKYSVSEIANIILAQYNVVDMEVQERDIEDIVAQIYARGNVYETTA